MIYRLKRPVNSHELIALDVMMLGKLLGDDDLSLVRRLGRLNESLAERWRVPVCSYHKHYREEQPKPDVSFWGPFLLLTQLAYDKLKSVLQGDGEFLPVQSEGDKLYFFNCLSVGEEAKGQCLKKYEDGYECGLETLVFNDADVAAKVIFKSKLEGYRTLFASDELKQQFTDLKLDGIVFDEDLTNTF